MIREGQLTTQTHPLLLDAPAEPLMVLMDAMRIEQVLTNLSSKSL